MGFDRDFLAVRIELPNADDENLRADEVLLEYVHFAVRLDRSRRLARVTGVNVDGASLLDLARGDDWRFDGRIPSAWQAGPAVYAANDLDRGHLVRRRDPVWGEREEALRANSDTFHFTNAAPQASGFNQSKELWLGLEDHVLAFANAHELRISVFTAPVLDPADPPYRDIRIPLRFWKVVAWVAAGGLCSAGFVLDQESLLADREVERMRRVAGRPPPLGPFRTFQVPVGDIADRAGLLMTELVEADVLPPAAIAEGWRPLAEPSDIVL